MKSKLIPEDIFDGNWVPADVKYDDNGKPLILLMARKDTSLLIKPFYNMEFSDCTKGLWVPLKRIDTKQYNGHQPHGFIYHTGRSGSTITCQMLTKIPGTLVFSEPAPLFKLLTPLTDVPVDEIVNRLIQAYQLITYRYIHSVKKIIIKWPSWCCLYIDVIQKAFPDVPGIFITRDPEEIIASIKTQPPRWLASDSVSILTGLPYEETKKFTRIENYARAIGRYYQNINDAVNRPLSVDYQYGPLAITEHAVRKFNIPYNDNDMASMQERAKYYSKDYKMQLAYVNDSEIKRSALSDFDRKLITKFITPYMFSGSSAG